MLDKINEEVDLLQRHLNVMNAVAANGPIGIMKLTEVLHEPQHRVRYSLRVLEQMGYIQATASGAVATDKAHSMLETLDLALDEVIGKLRRLHTAQ